MTEKLKQLAPIVVRIGVALVFVWFGLEQLTNVSDWTGWLPNYARSLPISPETLVYVNGVFETALGLLLLTGLYTRLAASLFALHMAHIITVVGYGEIGVRDFAIFMATLSTAFHGADGFSLDYFFSRKDKGQNL
ncbi:MAG: DoxX family membrane protein [Patescibacteria group bacterium]